MSYYVTKNITDFEYFFFIILPVSYTYYYYLIYFQFGSLLNESHNNSYGFIPTLYHYLTYVRILFFSLLIITYTNNIDKSYSLFKNHSYIILKTT